MINIHWNAKRSSEFSDRVARTLARKEIGTDELAFSRTFGIVPPFPRLAGGVDKDNKSRATAASCLPWALSAQVIMASDWYSREMRLVYARGFEVHVDPRYSALRFFLKRRFVVFVERSANIGQYRARERSPPM